MKLSRGAWLPDDETDRVMLSCGALYQHDKLMAAMPFVRSKRLAVDVGAHCGLWSMQMAELFEDVIAFEPMKRHIECFKKNVEGVVLHETALGQERGMCGIYEVEGKSGRSYVDGIGSYPMALLDDFGLNHVDLLKVDAEGYELFILKGGEDTLNLWRPTVIVEQKPGHAQRFGLGETDAVKYLESLGAKVRVEILGDYIMSWDERS